MSEESSFQRRLFCLQQHLSVSDEKRWGDDGVLDRNECKATTSGNEKKKKKKNKVIIEPSDVENFEALPLPPVAPLDEGVLFPKFPDMRQHVANLNKPPIFTYEIAGGRRMTIVNDRDLYKLIFFPDREHLTSNQEVLAYHWFGIEKELSMDYTNQGLVNTRKVLKESKAKVMNDIVGAGIESILTKDFGDSGEADLMEFAWLTFWPVNAAMFGAETVSPQVCPHIRQDLETYNTSFELVANGMPRKMFPEMEECAVRISKHFGDMISAGNAEKDTCPLLKARNATIPKEDTRWNDYHRGRFIMSLFWAAQANTIPGTFWAIAMALADPGIKQKCVEEARGAAFANQPDENGKYDVKKLTYINALVKEILRLKVANITHRKVQKEFAVKGADGTTYRIPKGDTMTVCSHLGHYDDAVYENPTQFRPERWLEGKKYPANSWFPFGGGPNTCSGKFLALKEIATAVALLFRKYDMELLDPVPEEEWDNVVAMVTPKKPLQCRVKFTAV